jgi:molybdopterin molybdotransferase
MPEFIRLLPPDEARDTLLGAVQAGPLGSETVKVVASLGRVSAADVAAPHALPEFPRSTVDGYAVRARDTYGAADSLPAYLDLAGEIAMGEASELRLEPGQCALIHTGGVLPSGASAVVMLEYSQTVESSDARAGGPAGPGVGVIEIFRAVAEGENTIAVGEDIVRGTTVLKKGHRIGPATVGALLALGIVEIEVARRPRVALISTGDEVVDPSTTTRLGQVRDVNSYTLSAVIEQAGGIPDRYGIVRDDSSALRSLASIALAACDVVVITAGSSASTRDTTAAVIDSLGSPGVLVHGINTRPGKPTILGVCEGKALIGLPGNPVSALVNGYMFLVPLIEKLLGTQPRLKASIRARLTTNLASEAGREDWWPVKLATRSGVPAEHGFAQGELPSAEPVFGKSNFIATLATADGIIRIPAAATGLAGGEEVDVYPL